VKLLSSTDMKTHEHAVMALLNLSIHSSNKGFIVPASVINHIIDVLKHGSKRKCCYNPFQLVCCG
jgi:hypothetical protein